MIDPANARPTSAGVDYGALLRRRWWVLVLCLAIGALLGAGALSVLPKTYTSSTNVQVKQTGVGGPADLANSRTHQALNLDTEAQLVTSRTVAQAVLKTVGSSLSPTSLLARVTVTVPPNSEVLTITATGHTPIEAQHTSHAFASAYLTNRTQSATDAITAQRTGLKAQITGLQKTLATAAATLDRQSPNTGEHTVTAAQVRALGTQINQLQQTLNNADSIVITPGTIISDAPLPQHASAPSPTVVLSGGILLGLLAGIALAWAIDRYDDRLHSARDVERLLGTPPLVEIGIDKSRRPGGRAGRVDRRALAAKTFGRLANAVESLPGTREGAAAVLVTSATPGDSGSITAAGLAAALARTSESTVLVLADHGTPVTSEVLGLPPAPGLADVLRADATVSAVTRDVRPGLRAIAPGNVGDVDGPIPARRMTEVVHHLLGEVGHVVLAAPPVPDGSSAQALGRLAALALVVVEIKRTTRRQLVDAVHQLEEVDSGVLQLAVVTTAKPRRPRHAGNVRRTPRSGDRRRSASLASELLGVARDAPAAGTEQTPSSESSPEPSVEARTVTSRPTPH